MRPRIFGSATCSLGSRPRPAREDVLRLYPAHVEGLSLEADEMQLASLRRLARVQAGLAGLAARAEAIKDELAAAMGPAERLTHAGQTLASWRSCKPAKRIDASRLRRECPQLAQSYTVESAPTRRLCIGGSKHV